MRKYVVALKESLEKKVGILEEIQRICDEQTRLLSEEKIDYEHFDALVDDKDICIEKIDKLDEGFETVYDRVKAELNANRAEYTELIKEMQELIKKITDKATAIEVCDRRNKQTLETLFMREKRGMSEAKRSVSVAYNYYKNMSGLSTGDSMYMDKKK